MPTGQCDGGNIPVELSSSPMFLVLYKTDRSYDTHASLQDARTGALISILAPFILPWFPYWICPELGFYFLMIASSETRNSHLHARLALVLNSFKSFNLISSILLSFVLVVLTWFSIFIFCMAQHLYFSLLTFF